MLFTPFPGMETERLVLRQLRLEDAKEIFALKPQVNSFEEARAFITKINNGVATDEWILWAAAVEDRLVGTVCLWNLSLAESKGEIGYELLPAYQGKGFMQEAVTTVLEFGFGKMGLHVIEGVTEESNLPSIRLLERNGFEKVGLLEGTEVLYRLKRKEAASG